ncbi:MAG: hypothetical protein V4538_15615 [Bacteroidota bacterium]
MENNESKIHVNKLMEGLNGLVSMLDTNMKESLKGMTPEQAMEFARGMNKADVPSKVEEIKDAHNKLKQEFNID